MSFNFRQLIVSISFIFLTILLSSIAFIKFNTSAAAELTDKVLRPLFGDKFIIFLEEKYYNSADLVNHYTFQEKNLVAPKFYEEGKVSSKLPTALNLNPINPITNFKPQPNEGKWKTRQHLLFPDKNVLAYTFVRSDPARAYSITTLLQIDSSKVRLGSVAGKKQPGGPIGNFGPGKIPENIINSGLLIGAFDGGFQYRDGNYGMIVGEKTYLPLKDNLATLVGYKNGTIKLIDYTGQDLGKDIEFVRQNCPLLIDNGAVVVVDQKNKSFWGRTPNSGTLTWRSGFGITKEGNFLFAVGNSLTPETLAYALKMGGAVQAMQLDINPYWVRFNIFEKKSTGGYKTNTLTRDLKDGSTQYLQGYDKDFFYLYAKTN